MASRRIGPVAPGGLSEADLMLAVYGPWHPAAGVEETSPSRLWHPRVDAARLELLLAQHGPAIRAAAEAAGVEEPWVVSRCWFTRLLDGHVDAD